jgi:hypothetical protein
MMTSLLESLCELTFFLEPTVQNASFEGEISMAQSFDEVVHLSLF